MQDLNDGAIRDIFRTTCKASGKEKGFHVYKKK